MAPTLERAYSNSITSQWACLRRTRPRRKLQGWWTPQWRTPSAHCAGKGSGSTLQGMRLRRATSSQTTFNSVFPVPRSAVVTVTPVPQAIYPTGDLPAHLRLTNLKTPERVVSGKVLPLNRKSIGSSSNKRLGSWKRVVGVCAIYGQ